MPDCRARSSGRRRRAVRVRVGGAVLGEPQPGRGFRAAAARRGRSVAGRRAGRRRPGRRRRRRARRLGQRVDEGVQRPHQRGRRAVASLKSNAKRASASASRMWPARTSAIARMKLPWASAISHPRGRASRSPRRSARRGLEVLAGDQDEGRDVPRSESDRCRARRWRSGRESAWTSVAGSPFERRLPGRVYAPEPERRGAERGCRRARRLGDCPA